MENKIIIKVSKEYRDSLAEKMKKNETYEEYLKKFTEKRNKKQ